MIDAILEKALAGREVSVEEGAALFAAEGDDLERLLATADEMRRRRVGDRVGYVINRNVNFTNVCVKRCGFCAFRPLPKRRSGAERKPALGFGVPLPNSTATLRSTLLRPRPALAL